MTSTDLANRVEALTRSDNETDVLVEIALFKPGTCYTAIRANAAGTKVIYTDRAGNQVTCWAGDWTHNPVRRAATVLRLNSEQPT